MANYMLDLGLLTYDDFTAVSQYQKEKARGELTPHEDMQKELGL